MKTRILKLLLAVVLICLPQIGISNAYFFDQTTISGISVTTGDWTAPYVKIESPSHGQSLSGSIEIYGTVTDNAPYHYWLVVQTPGGSTVAGPGTVNDFVSFTNKLLFTWDTTKMANGSYIIKLEARDAAGNKDPNLSPVLVDPENPNDSVDWITVTVNNAPPTPTPIPTPTPTETVVINEIMWMGSSSHDNDEWIELRNTTNTTVNLAGWYLTGAGAGASVINLTGSIGPNGYYLVSNYNSDHSQSALNNSLVLDQHAANLSFLNAGEVAYLYKCCLQ
ncbi:MAG: lamin tail domain-containing protein [Candidatus Gottesmanbacteria bacterium]|nr:lamin tail domain-containing protein [Candidatus Gottesmanbacteria bacterium]